MELVPRVRWLAYAGLVAITLITRFYRLGWNPLWLDEMYSYQISSQNVYTILRNSMFESHPPLYYLLLKVTSYSGAWRSEWGIRWFSAFCGSLALLSFYWLASRLTNRRWAMLGWFLLLVSPTVMYFSQEARSYIVVMLISVLTMAVMSNLLDPQKSSRQDWAVWTVLSMIGVYTAYCYLMILAVQAFCLLWTYRLDRRLAAAFGLGAVSLLPLVPLLLSNLGSDLQAAMPVPLTFPDVVEFFFADDPNRYGVVLNPAILSALLGLVVVLGGISAFERRDRFRGYLLLQLIFPLALYFGIGTILLHWRMPAYQNRQFLVLLPSLFLLTIVGLQWCSRRFPIWAGYGLAVGVSILILTAAIVGLERYETMTKSPEGLAVLAVRQRLGADDAVVSLHNYLSSAAGFYLAQGCDLYAWPQQMENGYFFDDKLFILSGQTEVQPRFPLSAIRAHSSMWILRDWREIPAVLPILVQGCQMDFQQLFGRFEILKLTHCQPDFSMH
jgi:hypothetical protein